MHGVEQIKGREVSFQVLSVSHAEWLQPGAKPRKGQMQMGNFWAGKPFLRKQIILKVNKKEFRTGSIKGLKPDECEKILSQLMSEDYNLSPRVKEKTLKQVDWTSLAVSPSGATIFRQGFCIRAAREVGFLICKLNMTVMC